MKHKHLIAVIASGLTVVASCTSNSKASAKEEGCGQATEQTDARAEETFVTEDLKTFGLQGHVKTVTISQIQKDNSSKSLYTISFDQEGRLTALNDFHIAYDEQHPAGNVTDENGLPVRRDEQGRILAIEQMGGCQKGYFFEYLSDSEIRFTDNPDDLCEGVAYYTWKRDADHRPADEAFETYGIGYSATSTTRFTYDARDAQGNWTARTGQCHLTEEIGDEMEEEVTTEQSDSEVKQTQQISYYN